MFKKIIVFSFFLFVTLLYLHNVTRDIYSGDVGDLTTSALVGGVPHPPGYPLFTFLCFIISHLPLPLPPVSKIALISIFASVLGLFILYKYSLSVTKSVFLSLLTVSILAFSYLYWLHAELPEVFGFNNLFVISILYVAIRFHETKHIKDLYILTFLIALSLTHHHTILLIFPAVGLLVIRHIRMIFRKKKHVLFLIFFFLAGLLPYLYVPIAASQNPVINWDHASTLENFIRLILRKDYGGFAPSVFNGVPTVVKTILAKDFLKTIVSLYSYQIILVALLGAVKLFAKKRCVFVSLMTAFLIPGPLFIFYSASVITTTTAWGVNERFYIMASVVFMFFVPYGFLFLKEVIRKKFKASFLILLLLSYFLIVPYFMIISNYPRTDLSKVNIGNNLAKDILLPLPKNAILFVSGDSTTFNIWYLHYGLGVRKDVEIINPGGVGANNFLDSEINKYHKKHPKTKLNNLINLTFEELRKNRRIFSTFDLDIRLKDTVFVPYGLVYEAITVQDIPEKKQYLEKVERAWKLLHIPRRETLKLAEQNLVTPEIPLIYSNGLIRVGDFLISRFDDPAASEPYYRRAQWIDPMNPGGYAGLGLSLFRAYGECEESITQMKKAISTYKVWKRYYLQLYILYDRCKKPSPEKKQLENLYRRNFNEDLREKVTEQL